MLLMERQNLRGKMRISMIFGIHKVAASDASYPFPLLKTEG